MNSTDVIFGIKAVGADGLSFRSQYTTGRQIDYAAHVGHWIEVEAAPHDDGQCAAGLHLSPTAIDCCQIMRGKGPRPWRFFELAVEVSDIAWPAPDAILGENKWRARRVYVVRELDHADPLVFGAAIGERIKRCAEIAGTWKAIPWLKPAAPVSEARVVELVGQWRERLTPYLAAGRTLPSAVRLVRTHEEAAAAAAADAAAAAWRPLWLWWYVRPWSVLRRHGRWALGGLPDATDPFAPLVDLYRLGCMPIGYVRGEFVVWAPEVQS